MADDRRDLMLRVAEAVREACAAECLDYAARRTPPTSNDADSKVTAASALSTTLRVLDLASIVDRLLTETPRAALPVIQTCRECGHWRTVAGDPTNAPGSICGIAKPRGYVNLDRPPPPQCPLRRGAP